MAIVALRKPVTKEFTLQSDQTEDEGQRAVVTIAQSNRRGTELRSQLFDKTTQHISMQGEDGSVLKMERQWNYTLQQRKEVFLTLCGAVNIKDEHGTELFPSKDTTDGPRLALSESEFNERWGLLPDAVAEEIHSYALEMNPTWSGAGE